MRRAVAAGLVLLPAPAAAHGMLQGVGEVYAGLLHPLVVPAEALALLATALLLGACGRAACRAGLPALAAALAAGLALGRHVPLEFTTPALLAAAFLAAALVTAGIRLAPPAAVLVAAIAGMAVGIDATPEAGSLRQILTAGSASLLGASALVVVIAGLTLGRQRGWQGVAVRVAGSWITASAILYFAWLATSGPI